ncbi:1-phosphofructokinase family hexose kinase [Acaricomes phytoseiuli]|uniref:1-phosphofructokinase family hexose kinase n=1 Tax=Acaricomes phytoseiuli TaxID=291968 RepID=UPI000368AA2D|nr:1-phosphofructokinase family hexose kinase [Acaricomes phytoseiuli]MCW1250032.1 1-phosphofructokinase family hexose kinase [Acaricomes phytoseiuli]
MIVTLTPNPSLDRTIELGGPLERGAVQRACGVDRQPGGKGVNIARAVTAAQTPCLALLPGATEDPVLTALSAEGIAYVNLPLAEPLRSNITVTEPDGTTTKINEPGPALSADQQRQLIQLCIDHAKNQRWLVLAGSLPQGVAEDFYAQIIRAVRTNLGASAPLIAVDSSGAPLREALEAAPDLIKPNAEELAELCQDLGLSTLAELPSAEQLETQPGLVADLAGRLIGRMGEGPQTMTVLATLGAHGAIFAEKQDAWYARGPKIIARSTVGAGDSALSGYLLAQLSGLPAQDRLRQAVAHGSAATALPGSTMPKPEHIDASGVDSQPISGSGDHPLVQGTKS